MYSLVTATTETHSSSYASDCFGKINPNVSEYNFSGESIAYLVGTDITMLEPHAGK